MNAPEEKLRKLDADLARIRAEHAATAAADATTRIEAARAAAKQARLDAVIDPSPAATKAAEGATKELERLIEAESDGIERERFLAEVIATLESKRSRLKREVVVAANEARRAHLAAAGPRLEALIAEGAPAAQRWVALVVACEAMRGRPAGRLNFGCTVAEWITGTWRNSSNLNPSEFPTAIHADAAAILARLERGEEV
jgi:hypothetical protein